MLERDDLNLFEVSLDGRLYIVAANSPEAAHACAALNLPSGAALHDSNNEFPTIRWSDGNCAKPIQGVSADAVAHSDGYGAYRPH